MEKPHKKLEAWKQSMDLVTEIYTVTNDFPHQEAYGITNQIRRAAVKHPEQHRRRSSTTDQKGIHEFSSCRPRIAE
jgi:four helix bundle protein